jgi:hypothetical protein
LKGRSSTVLARPDNFLRVLQISSFPIHSIETAETCSRAMFADDDVCGYPWVREKVTIAAKSVPNRSAAAWARTGPNCPVFIGSEVQDQ